ncbi:MAG TPA: NAD-dependent deacylase [bacterium]|nr:NAD-dependent deacylase [bacterium]
MTTISDRIQLAGDLLRRSRWTAVLTGAGVGTESGLPDFRSTPVPGGTGGLWTGIDPMRVASASAFARDPDAFYRFYQQRLSHLAGAEPNPAHQAIARLEALGLVQLVITQNVDRLHQEAGSRHVVEVHGNLREARCQRCGKVVPIGEMTTQLEAGDRPRCAECGDLLRPNVVLFEELLPAEAYDRGAAACLRCETLLVVGSSLEVYPVAGLPQLAKEHGAKVVMVNREPTARDHLADVRLQGQAGEILPALVEAVQRAAASRRPR